MTKTFYVRGVTLLKKMSYIFRDCIFCIHDKIPDKLFYFLVKKVHFFILKIHEIFIYFEENEWFLFPANTLSIALLRNIPITDMSLSVFDTDKLWLISILY